MSDTLAGIRAKVERAKYHIGDLEKTKRSFFDSDPYKVASRFVPDFGDRGQSVYYISTSVPIPADIALIAGDAVHNLRSALDHLVFQLGKVSGLNDSECTGLYFPICDSAKKYGAEAPRKLKGIKDVIQQAINATHPYKGGAGHGNTLWALHKLDIIDKHRLLITVGGSLKRFGVEFDWADVKQQHFPNLPPEIVNRGKDTAWFDPIPDRHFELNQGHVIFVIEGEDRSHFEFTFDIAFADIEIIERHPIFETLSTMANIVESIVSDFTWFLA